MDKAPSKYATEQEEFWAGEFGHEYLERNASEELITANVVLFSQVLRCAPGVSSITELGCMAHARRKFFDLHKANQSPVAAEDLVWISALDKIEDDAKTLDPSARRALPRQETLPFTEK